MRIRRIFRPSLAARLRAPLAVAAGAGLLALVLLVAVPRDLFGSAPQPPALTVPAPEIRVLDGETLCLGDRTLRLHALQVPERGQAGCRDAAGRGPGFGAAAPRARAGPVGGGGPPRRLPRQGPPGP